ncbi:putative polysaccharide biosynthesis protein [Alicyclobacillus acidocaldarius]|uniref:Polysaccharide biosynthesis protein n=1 Tax=Alicyclobacillus acidocaldarius (strain Tc-4-1) TaxID=1048834 RepID=F8IIY3_ALIAT|nr:polysaccharide biosynthesis protein [Alicyclobacillus acidocaldarius]AEJ42134.1 polysaccharide biosynthesis protein [Alicyclobacillus acidocaldarius subsp. acidocaldarius Tc-4-1]
MNSPGSGTAKLARGTSLYVICVALAKVLGLVWVIPVTAIIGPTGNGIYGNAYAVYNILQQLATSGFPLAMGKLIAERRARGERAVVEHIYRVTMRSLMIFSVCAFAVMWFGAPIFAHMVSLKDSAASVEQNVPSLRAVSLMLLVIPAMSGLRGYLQGFQRLEGPAYSQTFEQLFRVIAMVVGAYLVVDVWHRDRAVYGAAAATFGGFVGGLAGLILLVAFALPIRRRERPLGYDDSPFRSRQILRMVYHIALPVSLGGLVVPIANLVDSWTVTNLLQVSGESYAQAVANYGILTRQAMYLVMLPMSFAYAIGVSVLPSVSAAKAKRSQADLQMNITFTLRTMFLMSFPTSAALLVLSRPINLALFGTTAGSDIISTVSFMSIFASMELISTYVLQGLGKMYRPVRNMFLGLGIKTALNFALILGLHNALGAALATTCGYIVSSLLNVAAVRKYGQVHFSLRRLMRPFFRSALVAAIAMFGADYGLGRLLHAGHGVEGRLAAVIELLVAGGVGALVYLLLVARSGVMTEEEFRSVPGVGKYLGKMARRLRKPPRRPGTERLRKYP